MIRLTLLYNLPDNSDEAEFLKWRLGEHQQVNAAMSGVIRHDARRMSGELQGHERPDFPDQRGAGFDGDVSSENTLPKAQRERARCKVLIQTLASFFSPLHLCVESFGFTPDTPRSPTYLRAASPRRPDARSARAPARKPCRRFAAPCARSAPPAGSESPDF